MLTVSPSGKQVLNMNLELRDHVLLTGSFMVIQRISPKDEKVGRRREPAVPCTLYVKEIGLCAAIHMLRFVERGLYG